MARKFLCLYYDMIPALESLSDAEAGRLLIAALKYSRDGETAVLPGKESILWPVIMAQIERDNAKYNNRCETNRKNISSRYDRIRTNTTVYDRTQEKEKEKENEEEKENKKRNSIKRKRAFVPPTLEEVEAFCRERNSSVNPRSFYEYFTADPESQWIDSKGNPVNNWKQKIITWEGKGYGQRVNPDHAPKRSEEWNVHYDN